KNLVEMWNKSFLLEGGVPGGYNCSNLKTSVQKGFTEGNCQHICKSIPCCPHCLQHSVRYHLCVILVCTSIWLVDMPFVSLINSVYISFKHLDT
uniref:Uncharacterized protein n=1 Tax=Xenopus tropicalis TaxID=8364 RepID=A0A803JGS8_XENTR